MRIYSSIRKAARVRLLRRQPPCRDMVELMSQSLERPLSLRERLSLRLHLIVCVWCVRYLQQLNLLRLLGRTKIDCPSEDTLPSLTLSEDARTRVNTFLNRNRQT